MPASVGRHNLARIRKLMGLTQVDLGRMLGRSAATIKSIEIGKLALSEGLANRINETLGIRDKAWLLANDLQAPVPSDAARIAKALNESKIIEMRGPETAFVDEIMTVIERHSQELTVHQICGGLFAAAHEVLTGEHEDI
jgi:transcriptional regulator with XRE-family HTH domain